MREAEKEYGFCVDESMVYVEASATASGIFTLTVTKTANSLNQSNLKSKTKSATAQHIFTQIFILPRLLTRAQILT